MINNILLLLAPMEQNIDKTTAVRGLPLSLGIIQSYLVERNIDVSIHDMNLIFDKNELPRELFRIIYNRKRTEDYLSLNEDTEIDNLLNYFLKDKVLLNYDAYGISMGSEFSVCQIHISLMLAVFLKKTFNKTVIIGGSNITYTTEFEEFFLPFLKPVLQQEIQIIIGPGEEAIYQLLKADGNIENISEPTGYLQLQKQKIIINEQHYPRFICPTWDGFDLDSYYVNTLKEEKALIELLYKYPIQTANMIGKLFGEGRKKLIIPYLFNYFCQYNCAFCTQSGLPKRKMITHDPIQVICDLNKLKNKYDSNFFYFLNNYFPSDEEFIYTFHDEMKRNNLEIFWSDCGRINNLDYNKLQLMKESGCRKLVFGFETASKKLLNLINKNLNLDKMIEILSYCKELGIFADLEIIIGLPGETETDYQITEQFIDKHLSLINRLWINQYFIIPNSIIGRSPEKFNIEIEKYYMNYDQFLDKNEKAFMKDSALYTSNYQLFRYRDYNGRNFEEVEADNRRKFLHFWNKYSMDDDRMISFMVNMKKNRGIKNF